MRFIDLVHRFLHSKRIFEATRQTTLDTNIVMKSNEIHHRGALRHFLLVEKKWKEKWNDRLRLIACQYGF